LLAQGQVLEGELAMAAEEEGEEPKQVEQESDHRAEIVAGSEPTDQPLGRTRFWRRTTSERRDWAGHVAGQLRDELHSGDRVVILAGENYRQHLVPTLRELGCEVEIPMRGLGIGQQLGWLKRKLRSTAGG